MAFRKKSTRELVAGDSAVFAGTPTPKKKEKKERGPGLPLKLRLKSRGFLGGVCIILALLLAFVATPMIADRDGAVISVVTLTADAKPGQMLTADLLTLREVGRLGLPADAITNLAAAKGRYLTTPMLEGDILTGRRLQDNYPTDTPELLGLGDRMAVSVALADLAQSVSGRLRAGDIIQLFAVLRDNGTGQNADPNNYVATLIPELQAVEVLLVTDGNSTTVEEGQTGEAEQVATVILSVNQNQAAALVGLHTNATLHAALLCRDDPERKEVLLKAQAEVLGNGAQATETEAEPAVEPAVEGGETP